MKSSSASDAASENMGESASTFVPVEPFEIIVFGGTGDLARRKLIPSLFHRFCDGQVSADSKIIGVSRSKHTRKEYLELIKSAYDEFVNDPDFSEAKWKEFTALVDYVAIDVLKDDANWKGLKACLDSKSQKVRVFYLAMPPKIFPDVCRGLKSAKLVTKMSRVVLEKPLGTDYESARAINAGVGEVFPEDSIYRIDHYLGKETVQNLLALRFGNILLEPLWSNAAIDHIQITAAESIGVGGRGSYYDGSGALRDMVQNHMLQLLCLTAMEAPASLSADDVRTEKIKVLRALKPISEADVEAVTVRGQYTRGHVGDKSVVDYLSDVGLDRSTTETYVAIKASIENWRWAGVPIYLRTGKRMATRRSEIVIQFKPVPHSVFGPSTHLNPNKLVIRLQPDEAVRLWLEIKEPGAGGLRMKTLPLNLTYADNFTVRYPDAYERLLMDVVRGNLSLFMRRDEVETAWLWVDKILEGWAAADQRVELYQSGEDGPREAEDMLNQDGRSWLKDKS